jgi:hypothetical protein
VWTASQMEKTDIIYSQHPLPVQTGRSDEYPPRRLILRRPKIAVNNRRPFVFLPMRLNCSWTLVHVSSEELDHITHCILVCLVVCERDRLRGETDELYPCRRKLRRRQNMLRRPLLFANAPHGRMIYHSAQTHINHLVKLTSKI